MSLYLIVTIASHVVWIALLVAAGVRDVRLTLLLIVRVLAVGDVLLLLLIIVPILTVGSIIPVVRVLAAIVLIERRTVSTVTSAATSSVVKLVGFLRIQQIGTNVPASADLTFLGCLASGPPGALPHTQHTHASTHADHTVTQNNKKKKKRFFTIRSTPHILSHTYTPHPRTRPTMKVVAGRTDMYDYLKHTQRWIRIVTPRDHTRQLLCVGTTRR
jgi:hypothetical protein